MTEQEVKNEADMMAANTTQFLHTQLVNMASKHATVSYTLIAVLCGVLALAGVGGYIGLKFADAQLARAEKQEEQYNADRKVWQEQMTANAAARNQDTARQQVVVKVVDSRDKSADAAIQEAVKPTADLETVRTGLQLAYKDVPAFGVVQPTNDGKIALGLPQAQQITAYKIDRDRLAADLADEKTNLGLEQHKTELLSLDLSTAKKTDQECQTVVTAYKKAAQVSKLRKVLSGATKALLFGAGLYLGSKL